MPQQVEVTGFGLVEFPDAATPEQIQEAIQTHVAPLVVQRRRIAAGQAAAQLPPVSPNWEGVKGAARRTLADPLLSAAKGIVGVPEAAVGVSDILTGGGAGKLAESAGVNFKGTQDILSGLLSPEQQAANARVQQAKGFFPTVQAALENPSTIAHQVIEATPSMLAGGAVARGAIQALPKLSPLAAGAIGEGAITAGQMAEQVRQEQPSKLLTWEQAGLALAGGTLTGAIGGASGKLAERLGIKNLETILAGGGDLATKRGRLAQVIGGALTEGAIEELPQSAQEQVVQNLAQGKPWNEGVAEAAASGLLAGMAMGAGFNALDAPPVPKTGTAQPPVTPDVTPPAPEQPKVEVTRDLAKELQAALTGNQGKAPPVTPAVTPQAPATPTGPLRFRAIVAEGKVPSELVIQPLTEELYDAVIHVEGLTPDFDQFKAENPDATHLKRQLLPTGKFASGHKFGPLNELVPPGIGSQWEDITNAKPEGRREKPEDSAPAAPLSARLSPLSSQTPTPPPPAAAVPPPAAPASPAPAAAVSPAPATAQTPQALPSSPAGDSLAAPLTPPAAVPTVTPAETETVTAGTAGREAGTQGEKAPTASPTPASSGLATEPGVSPGPTSEISQAGRTSLGKAASRVTNGRYRQSTTTDADGLLHTLGSLGLKLPYFKPDRGAVTYFEKLTAKARRNEPLTPKEKAALERFRRTFPVNFEDNYGPGGEIMEAAYQAAQRAGLAVELFTEQRGQFGGEWDTKLDELRAATGKNWTLRELFEAIPPLAEGHRARVRGETSAEENAELDKRAEQDMAFQRDQRTNRKDTELIPPDDLREGMSYTLRGRKLRVTDLDIDEDGRVVAVELEDGDRYGTQRLLAEDGSEVPALRADTGSAVGTASQKRAEQQDGGAFSRLTGKPVSSQSQPVTNEDRAAQPEQPSPGSSQAARLSETVVVDSKGNPLLVYHGGSGSPGNFEGYASRGMGRAFFTDSLDVAWKYALGGGIKHGLTVEDYRAKLTEAQKAGRLRNRKPTVTPAYLIIRNPVTAQTRPRDLFKSRGQAERVLFEWSNSLREKVEDLERIDGSLPDEAFWDLVDDEVQSADWAQEDTEALPRRMHGVVSLVSLYRSEFGQFDGFIYEDQEAGGNTFVVFEPNQIVPAKPDGFNQRAPVGGAINDIRNSRAEAAAEPAVSVASAQARADELTAKWVLPFGVAVVQSWRDLPARARRGITEQDGHTVEGRYVPGSGVFLVADNLASPDRVAAVVLHEVLGHFGIDTVLGEQRDAFMLDVFRSFQGKPLFQQKVRDYAGDFENGRTPVTQADKILLGRELVAALAENPAENPGLWQRIVDAVRRWLRDIGWVQDVTEADIREALRRAEAALRGVRSEELGVRSPGLVNLGGGVLMTPGAQLVDVRPDALAALTAHHGTPHKVDKFTTAKIGTGEGAQVYGWGLYFAENEQVAEEYRRNLAGKPDVIVGERREPLHLPTPDSIVAARIATLAKARRDLGHKFTPKDIVDEVARNIDDGMSVAKETKDELIFGSLYRQKIALARMRDEGIDIGPIGNTYTVTLNVEPEDLLDWDKPLSEQSEKVREGFFKAYGSRFNPAWDMSGSEMYRMLMGGMSDSEFDYMKGEVRKRTNEMLQAGIKGIRYLDQGSRPQPYRGDDAYLAAAQSFKNAGQNSTDALAGLVAAYKQADRTTLQQAVNQVYGEQRGTYNYVIFDENDIRITHENGQPVAAGQFSRLEPRELSELGFYDTILEALKRWQPKGTPEQLMAHLAKTRGALEQAEWIGLPEFLKGKPTVTNAEVAQFTRDNAVEVREVVRGGEEDLKRLRAEEEAIRAEVKAKYGENWFYSEDYIGSEEARRLRMAERDRSRAEQREPETKFQTYQLPGGENYRELLLTLPEKPRLDARQIAAELGYGPNEPLTPEVRAEINRRIDAANRKRDAQFRSSHFDEPNILAHVRFNERTDAQGRRVLFIEEVQSDWHKEGRKQGYAKTKEAMQARLDALLQVPAKERTLEQLDEINTLSADINSRSGGQTGVPDAPFKGTWPMLVMKRMLRWAAENNFDAVAWITGDQTAERYDLSKQVDSIRLVPDFEGRVRVNFTAKGGLVKDAGSHTAAELPELIGKDLAAKAIADGAFSDSKEYSGLDLKVGGEWARSLYDRTLPNEVNKFVKKWGGKVERAEINVSGGKPTDYADFAAYQKAKTQPATVHSLTLTPDLKDAALGGMPLFSRKVGVAPRTEPLPDLLARRDDAAARGITYAAQREKLRGEGKTIPESLKKAEREQAEIFKEAQFQLLRHPDYVAQQVRAVDAKLDELNTLKERQRILKQQGTDLESDARARLAELEQWLPIETGEIPYGNADEFVGIPPSLVKQAIERTSGLKHFITEAEKERVRAILDNPDLSPEQKDRLLADLERNRGRALAEVPLPNALPPRANVALATSTTLAGNQDARTWWESFARWARNLASATPEIPLFGPLARLNVPMRGFLNAIRAGNMTAARDAEAMVQDVVQPLMALPRTQLDPNALARHQAIARKLQAAERQFDQQAERMRAEIAAMEQMRSDRAAITERREALAEFEGNPPAKIAELQKQLAEAVDNLGTNPMWLFKQAVLFRDYISRWQMLSESSHKRAKQFKFPGNLSIQDVVNEMERTNAAIEASPARAAIKEAMDRHYRAMAELEAELLKRGHIIPEAMKNGAYFPHQVLDYTSQHLGRLKPATEAPFRGYLVDPTGSRKAIETDYIQAVYRHAAEVMAHNAHQDAVEKFLKPWDKSDSIRETVAAKAAAEGRTAGRFEWRSEDNLPPGYVFYDAAKKLPLRLGYVMDPQTIADALGIALKDGDVIEQMRKLGVDFVVEPEMLQQALVAGEKQPWVIPKEMAEALDGILERQRQEDAIARAPVTRRLRQAVALWKLNTLFAPWHYLRYEWGNTMSDVVDKLGGADPGMAKYLPQAFKEVIAFADKKEATPEIRAAFEQRVLDTITFAEVEKVKDSPAFEQLRSDTQRALGMVGTAAKNVTFPPLPIIRLLSGANVRSTVELSRLREATFRYAKFLADLNRIRNGERPVYAGAYWKDVEAEKTPEEKAAFIARRTFGDYGDMSVAGEYLRRNLVPFWSWTEINFRYHVNLLRNMADMIRKGEFGDAAQSARAIAAWTALRLALPYAAVHLWNTIGGAMAGAWDDDDDLEATLSDADRRRFHLILGKDERGQTKVIYMPTAFSDVVSWFGGDNAARLLAEYARGDITFERVVGDFAKQIGPDTLNKVAQSTGPIGKGLFIGVSGKQPFPDITNMRSVGGREKWFAVVQTMTDREGTDLLRRAFDNDYYPRPAGEVAQQLILQIRRRDPEQWAFYEVKEKVSQWKEQKTGKRFEAGDYQAPEAQALRGFRRAVYLGDVDAAERFYNRLLGFGYTSERLTASIRNQHPLAELNEEGRKEFIKGLSRADREQLRRALQYWERLSTLKGKERGLFPAKPGQRFTPQPERLRNAVESFDRRSDEDVERQARRLMDAALTGRK